MPGTMIFSVQIFMFLLLNVASLHSQNTTRPSFEVASVKPSSATVGVPYVQKGDRFLAGAATLKLLIAYAFQVRSWQILGGPEWVESQRWTVEAKASEEIMRRVEPSGRAAVRETIGLMLQSLLEERFGLKLQREIRQLPAFELLVARGGPKIAPDNVEAPLAGEPNATTLAVFDRNVPRGTFRAGRNSFEARGITVDTFINSFLLQLLDRPIIDKTDLKGAYDMKLRWTQDLSTSPATPDSNAGNAQVATAADVSFFTAVKEQLGLQLTSAKAPVEVLIISAAHKPTSN